MTIPPWLLLLLAVALAATTFWLGRLLPRSAEHAEVAASTKEDEAKIQETHDTPWGKLIYTRLNLSPPLDVIEEMATEAGPRRWFFQSASREELFQFFRKSGLSNGQCTILESAAKVEGKDYAFSPDDNFVRGLTPEARKNLYIRLAQDERNKEQINAFHYLGASIETWLAPAMLPPETVTQIKALCYRHEPYWLFADFSLVSKSLPSPQVRGRLLKLLATRPTWFVKMHIDQNSDINVLANYWGRGGRKHLVFPLLETLAQVPGGESASVSLFLPPFARTRLFTFPLPGLNPTEQNRDCHWTALNYFNEIPNDKFALGTADALEEIMTQYYPVKANFQLGDLVVFATKADDAKPVGKVFHSAVYIADNLVFTKNGRRAVDPWIYMRLDEMKAYYPQSDKVVVMYFRRKNIPGE